MNSTPYTLKPHPRYGFPQIVPTPSPEEIARFYSSDFYSGDYKKFNDSSLEVQVEDADFYNSRWDDICTTIRALLRRELKGLSLLDIGCGWGQALLYFRDKGIECSGFDPAPEAVAYGKEKGLNLLVAGLDKMDVFGNRFDVVTLLNVLEHLGDPEATLKEIREKVLVPSGLLIIDVPNEFNAFQVAGQKTHDLPEWWVSPPGHLNYFSGETLSNLLRGVGFKVADLQASFPLEMFLLMGRNYVADPKLGRACHKERVAFELNLRKLGQTKKLVEFYRALAKLGLGRQVVAYATA